MSASKRKQNTKTIRKVKKANVRASAMLLLVVTVFCMFSIVLVSQRNAINDLDSQIRDLEGAYKKAVMVNDDLQGQLLQAKNLNDVEKYAVKTLGMVKPDSSYITYVSYNDNGIKADAEDLQSKGNFLSWVSALFD